MRTMQIKTGTRFIISSHDPQVIAHADRVIRLRDGHIENEKEMES
jgi:ABC-type lipoprotein export system ATPase subunit